MVHILLGDKIVFLRAKNGKLWTCHVRWPGIDETYEELDAQVLETLTVRCDKKQRRGFFAFRRKKRKPSKHEVYVDFTLKKTLVPEDLDCDEGISLSDSDEACPLSIEPSRLERYPGSALVLCPRVAHMLSTSLNHSFGGTICDVPGRNDMPAAFGFAALQARPDGVWGVRLQLTWPARFVTLPRLESKHENNQVSEPVAEGLQFFHLTYSWSQRSLVVLSPSRTESLSQFDTPSMQDAPLKPMTPDRWKQIAHSLSPDGKVRFTSKSFRHGHCGQQCTVSAWGIVCGPLGTGRADTYIMVFIDADVATHHMIAVTTEANEVIFSRSLIGKLDQEGNNSIIMLSNRKGPALSHHDVRAMTLKVCENLRTLLLLCDQNSKNLLEIKVRNTGDDAIAQTIAQTIGTNRDIRAAAQGLGQNDGGVELGQLTWQCLQHLSKMLDLQLLDTTSIELSSVEGEGDLIPGVLIADRSGPLASSAKSGLLFYGGGLCLTIDCQKSPSSYIYLSTATSHHQDHGM